MCFVGGSPFKERTGSKGWSASCKVARQEADCAGPAQGLDKALADSQAQLADGEAALAARASSVAAREAACAASERQLAQRLAQLGLHERLLQERAARVVALEHDMQVRLRASGPETLGKVVSV